MLKELEKNELKGKFDKILLYRIALNHSRLVNPKWVLLQTVKTQMIPSGSALFAKTKLIFRE